MLKRGLAILWMSMILVGVFSVSLVYGASQTKKQLTVLTYANWNPFEYLDKGKLVGFDVELVQALAKEAGYTCEVENVGWDALFTQLKSGNGDLGISGITITDARKQTYDFSLSYFVSRQSMVVNADSGIKTAADLKTKTVAVQSGSTGEEATEKILGKNSPNIKKIKNGLTYLELMNNDVDAVVGDDTSNQKYLLNNPNKKLILIQDKASFDPEYFGMMFLKGSPLKTVFDKAFQKSLDNGIYSKIYQKWFGVKPDLKELKTL
jgi:glutamine transport system substrate-binding protein